ncbi:MAG: DUF3793 family protein [Lachnospiraceae bacterium]|nr:DUF3793 family protein [Lachnospiraceae bacterium]
MPINEITDFMNSDNCLCQVEMQLAIHCAPLLQGIKLSNLVKLTQAQSEELCRHIRQSGLSVWFLSYEQDGNQVLLFRRDQMQAFLNKSRIQKVLRRFGYHDYSLASVMTRLSSHMKDYKDGRQEFPHELGILLGYPICDVLAYMENHGENYKCCGYWKVYHDPSSALRRFAAFNEARDTAVTNVLRGCGYFHQMQACSSF